MAAPEAEKPKRRQKVSQDAEEAETPMTEPAVPNVAMSPLDYLLSILQDEGQPQSARVEAAKAAAPYLHPRLAQVAHGGAVHLTHEQALDELE